MSNATWFQIYYFYRLIANVTVIGLGNLLIQWGRYVFNLRASSFTATIAW